MRACIIIPCFNHPETVAGVAHAAQQHAPVIVVDDGSTTPLPALPGCTVIRQEPNRGKGAALRLGFQRAAGLGFTHAITMDADGQHFAEDLPQFLAVASTQPGALAVGVRDFLAAGCPTHRRRSNAVSTFWFRIETGVRLGDTQCGFRGYPVALAQRLHTRSGRYAFELELMVRAAWVGTPIVAVPVKCTYAPNQIRQSHFRPVKDLAHITFMNIGLVLQSWLVPRSLRTEWSFGERRGVRHVVAEFFSENAHEPAKMAGSVGVGLFFGIAPIWGVQLLTALWVAHRLRLNKAVTAVAANISIPPMVPFILLGAMTLGHWLTTGKQFELATQPMSRAEWLPLAKAHFWEWLLGSFALAVAVSAVGTLLTYGIARVVRKK